MSIPNPPPSGSPQPEEPLGTDLHTDEVPEAREVHNAGWVLREFFAWMRENLGEAIKLALIGALLSYIINTYLLVVQDGGFARDPTMTSPSTGEGNLLGGGLFWGLASMLVFGIYGYARKVGRERFLSDVRNLPREVMAMIRQDGHPAQAHLLWGATVSLLLSQIVLPSTSAVLGLGFLALLPSLVGRIISGFIRSAIAAVASRVAPARGREFAGVLAVAVGIAGAAAALLGASLIPSQMIRLILMVVTGVLAFVLGRRGRSAAPLAILLLAGVAAGLAMGHPLPVRADDGGWDECGGNIADYIARCSGNTTALVYALGAVPPAAAGATLGGFLGTILASLNSPQPWWSPGSAPMGQPVAPHPVGPAAGVAPAAAVDAPVHGPTGAAQVEVGHHLGGEAASPHLGGDAGSRLDSVAVAGGERTWSIASAPAFVHGPLMDASHAQAAAVLSHPEPAPVEAPTAPHHSGPIFGSGGSLDGGALRNLQDGLRDNLGAGAAPFTHTFADLSSRVTGLTTHLNVPSSFVPVHAAEVVARGEGPETGYEIVENAGEMFARAQEGALLARAEGLTEAIRGEFGSDHLGRLLELLRPAQGEYGGLSQTSTGLLVNLAGAAALAVSAALIGRHHHAHEPDAPAGPGGRP